MRCVRIAPGVPIKHEVINIALAVCRDCGRTVHDYLIPNEIWNDVITGSPVIYNKDGTPSKEGAAGVWCYDCFCERAEKKGYIAVFRCELAHKRKHAPVIQRK